jgi:hypothetical protein
MARGSILRMGEGPLLFVWKRLGGVWILSEGGSAHDDDESDRDA